MNGHGVALGQLLVSFLSAAVAVILAGDAAGLLPTRPADFVLAVVLALELFVALPAYFVLRRCLRETWVACALAGAVVGVVPLLVLALLIGPIPGSGQLSALLVAASAVLGAFGGVVFRGVRVLLEWLGRRPGRGRCATLAGFGLTLAAMAVLVLAE